MENSSKALYMAGSLLVALMIISLLVYAFNNIGGVQAEKDKQLDAQAIIDFNREFEAYEKKLMYGADLISCVNKAVSHNEKNSKGYGSSGVGDLDIDIEVTVHNKIKQTIQFYTFDFDLKRETKIPSTTDGNAFYNALYSEKIYNLCKVPAKTKIYYGKGTDINNDTLYGKLFFNSSSKFVFDEVVIDADSTLDTKALTELTSNSTNIKYKGYNNAYIYGESKWYSVEWTTALYNFKKGKFKWTGTDYDENNGKIIKMTFEEIK